MRKLLIINIAILLSISSFSQNNNWCYTDQHNQNLLLSNPTSLSAAETLESRIKKYRENADKAGEVLIIPTVVHVVHQFGAEDIDKSEVEDFIRIISDDFRRKNTDTTDTRPQFKARASDGRVEFRLAKIDPNGNCTDGVVRVKSNLSFGADDAVKSVSYWPSDQYFNVWTVASIAGSGGGTTLGYAQFPGFGAWSTYGFVSRADALASRTATHEAGHCFGLFHTFQSSCGGNCESSGDNVCDTPPTFENTWTCNFNLNTCTNDADGGDTTNVNPYSTDVEDQIENYMSYDNCQNMFTLGQADRMEATMGSFTQLTNLVSASNLTATGVDSGYSCDLTPVPDFCLSEEYQCTNTSAGIKNNTYNGNNITYLWDFGANGTATSTSAEEPNVTYTETGKYDITLTATDVGGSATKSKQAIAKVLNGNAINPFSESFKSQIFPINDVNDPTKSWFIDGVTNSKTWERTTLAASEGGASLLLDIKRTSGTHRLISPMIDLSNLECNNVTFDMAYAPRLNGTNETVKLRMSKNCGRTWRDSGILYEVTRDDIAPNTSQTSGDYIPTSSDWKSHTVDISSILDEGEVLFMFEIEVSTGNSLYLDNISFGCSKNPLSDEEELSSVNFVVYPNPTKSDATIQLANNLNGGTVSITDVTGKMVGTQNIGNNTNQIQISSLSSTELEKGMYFISVEKEGKLKTQKLIIN